MFYRGHRYHGHVFTKGHSRKTALEGQEAKFLGGFAWECTSLSGGLPRAGLPGSLENVGQEVMAYGLAGLSFLETGKVTLRSPARMHIE